MLYTRSARHGIYYNSVKTLPLRGPRILPSSGQFYVASTHTLRLITLCEAYAFLDVLAVL